MNAPATIEIPSELKSNDEALQSVAPPTISARPAAKSLRENTIRAGTAALEVTPAYRLGDAVHHGQLGYGQVMAHWPDGTLLIKFNGAAKSRTIWPSFLNRANGQRR